MKKTGVLGAGTMGAGIAQAFAMTDGYEVRLCDIKQEFADGGKARIEKNINFLVGKEKIGDGSGHIQKPQQVGYNKILVERDQIVQGGMHHVVRFSHILLERCEPRQIDQAVGQDPDMTVFFHEFFHIFNDLLSFWSFPVITLAKYITGKNGFQGSSQKFKKE